MFNHKQGELKAYHPGRVRFVPQQRFQNRDLAAPVPKNACPNRTQKYGVGSEIMISERRKFNIKKKKMIQHRTDQPEEDGVVLAVFLDLPDDEGPGVVQKAVLGILL